MQRDSASRQTRPHIAIVPRRVRLKPNGTYQMDKPSSSARTGPCQTQAKAVPKPHPRWPSICQLDQQLAEIRTVHQANEGLRCILKPVYDVFLVLQLPRSYPIGHPGTRYIVILREVED